MLSDRLIPISKKIFLMQVEGAVDNLKILVQYCQMTIFWYRLLQIMDMWNEKVNGNEIDNISMKYSILEYFCVRKIFGKYCYLHNQNYVYNKKSWKNVRIRMPNMANIWRVVYIAQCLQNSNSLLKLVNIYTVGHGWMNETVSWCQEPTQFEVIFYRNTGFWGFLHENPHFLTCRIQWLNEVDKNRITEYRSFGIIYWTEPNTEYSTGKNKGCPLVGQLFPFLLYFYVTN